MLIVIRRVWSEGVRVYALSSLVRPLFARLLPPAVGARVCLAHAVASHGVEIGSYTGPGATAAAPLSDFEYSSGGPD